MQSTRVNCDSHVMTIVIAYRQCDAPWVRKLQQAWVKWCISLSLVLRFVVFVSFLIDIFARSAYRQYWVVN